MSKKLTILELTALTKLAEKELDALKKSGKSVKPGNYEYDFVVRVDGSLGRGSDTQVTPPFKMSDLLKAVLLRYAAEMDEPQVWLEEVLSIDGALGAVIQLGSDAVIKTVDPGLVAAWDAAEAEAKAKHKVTAKKKPRAGNTSLVGSIEKLSDVVDTERV